MKPIILILAAALLVFPVRAAGSEPEDEVSGFVLEVMDDGFTLKNGEDILSVSVTDDTDWDVDRTVRAGDYVSVRYSPVPDCEVVTAIEVRCHILTGEVSSIIPEEEAYFMLLTDNGEAVRVNLGFVNPEIIAAGMPVTVYYSGIMTRSIPPQVTAEHIRPLTLPGEVVKAEADSLLLMIGDSPALIRITPETLVLTGLLPGSVITVSVLPVMTLSLPPQYTAFELLPAG